ncbi:FecR family protein [Variovorax soli]|uniref:FecR family protein n=1 Tax=Variovorax soli TaxID=376815 RepID=UPI000838A204|nr:FecR family protein [Variovorax soli]
MLRQQLGALIVGTSMLACGAAFAQAAPATRDAAAPLSASAAAHAGFVKSVQGTVRLVGPSGEQRALKVGDAVRSSNRIESDAGGGASVVLRDGTVLVLGPSSQLDLKQFDFDATTQEGGMFVSLVRGSLRMISGLLGKKPESVCVDTQTATIGIRGTDFIVTSGERI